MAEESGQEKSFEATPRKLEDARRKGDVPISREGAGFGMHAAVLVSVGLGGGLIAAQVCGLLLPFIEQPEAFLDLTGPGLRRLGSALAGALGLALAPLFGLMLVGTLAPYFAQGAMVVAGERIRPKASHLSPLQGAKRIFGRRGLFEFAKSLVKAGVGAASAYVVAKPLFDESAGFVALDNAAFPPLAQHAVVALLATATLVYGVIALLDIAFQQFDYRKRQRMTLQEMREELRSTEGDPHAKAHRRRLQRKASQRRMMADVPKATVVITNPTHFAVALRYRRGEDAAPVCVAKGMDHMALRIREAAAAAGVPVIEQKPLARALHASVEIGEVIPQAHFEAVAQVIGIIWARSAGARPRGRAG